MKKAEKKIYGAYIFEHCADENEIKRVKEVIEEYRNTAKLIFDFLWNQFLTTGKLPDKMEISVKDIESKLSERYKQVCLWQVYGVLQSYMSNLKNKFKRTVLGLNLSEEDKLILLALNRKNAWLRYDKEEIKIQNKEGARIIRVEESHKDLAKTIFHNLLEKNKTPTFERISLNLSSGVVKLLLKKNEKNFDYVLKISSLEKGKPIYIPLKRNSYAESVEGKFLNACQIIETENRVEFRLIKELKKKEYEPRTEAIAIDLGLNPVIATDRGDLIGRKFLSYLKKIDKQITERMRYLQKKGINPNSDKKYKEYIRRTRAFLENEINRMLNKLVEIYRPKKIIVEKLDFSGINFHNPEMNRIIRNFGKKFFLKKLRRLKELNGIEIVEVNPSYTSITCSTCGFVSKKNRKGTHEFECQRCGKKINAQINAARNILRRGFYTNIKLHTPKEQVYQILLKQYLERFKKVLIK